MQAMSLHLRGPEEVRRSRDVGTIETIDNKSRRFKRFWEFARKQSQIKPRAGPD